MPDDFDRPNLMAGDEPQVVIEEVELSRNTPSEIARPAIIAEHVYARWALFAGMVVILAGIVLIPLGATGSVDWSFKGLGIDSHLQTAALGIVVIIVGALLIVWTRPKVKITR